MLEEFSFGFPILSYLIFLPLAGAAVLWLIEDEDLLKTTTLGITLVELALACLVLVRFVPDSAAMQFADSVDDRCHACLALKPRVALMRK